MLQKTCYVVSLIMGISFCQAVLKMTLQTFRLCKIMHYDVAIMSMTIELNILLTCMISQMLKLLTLEGKGKFLHVYGEIYKIMC